MIFGKQNCVAEWSYKSTQAYNDPFRDAQMMVVVTGPSGAKTQVPSFWAGDDNWTVRYASPEIGIHTFETVCSNPDDSGLHGKSGKITIVEYSGDNALLRSGPLRKSESGTYLEHQDGTPFYWMGDTWWMGLTTRLDWPAGFHALASDRVDKGFSVIQIVAGLYPDMDPFDDRGANEGGFPWSEDFGSINPKYFDMADLKMAALVDAGLVPCIVGCWGYFLDFAGEDVIRRHWEYLIARYAAYPVLWCLAGEATMPFYLNEEAKRGKGKQDYADRIRAGWTSLTRHVKSYDPFDRPITIHPTQNGHDMVDEPELLDLDMLQTGHGSFLSLAPTVKQIREAVEREPRLPVINSEVCYEGICGTSGPDVQRFLYWSCALSGTCGHTYGANGIWQLNSRAQPYGPSPHGATWGDTPWEEAYQLPGSRQVGLGAKLLRRYRWWEFAAHPEWLERHSTDDDPFAPFAAGIPGEVRVFFFPNMGNFGWGEFVIKELEPGVQYKAFYFDPISGEENDQGEAQADSEGCWKSGKVGKFQDWVLVLEKSR
jgi:hypothetical protein